MEVAKFRTGQSVEKFAPLGVIGVIIIFICFRPRNFRSYLTRLSVDRVLIQEERLGLTEKHFPEPSLRGNTEKCYRARRQSEAYRREVLCVRRGRL
jgi:hypothetical protein